ILGVYVREQPPLQIAFVDTPGLHAPVNALGRALLQQTHAALAEADVVLLVTQVGRRCAFDQVLGAEERALCAELNASARPVVLAINKIDQLKQKELLLPCIERCARAFNFAATVPISARSGNGLPALVSE